jgi:hypothetical protein
VKEALAAVAFVGLVAVWRLWRRFRDKQVWPDDYGGKGS